MATSGSILTSGSGGPPPVARQACFSVVNKSL